MIDSCRSFVLRKTMGVDPNQATPTQIYNAIGQEGILLGL